VGPFPAGAAFGGASPLTQQLGGLGATPYAGLQTLGVNPIGQLLAHQLGAGISPTINPMVAAQLATTNPLLLSYLAQQAGGGIGALGGQAGLGPVSPIAQLSGAGQFGAQPSASQFGQAGVGQWGSPLGAMAGQSGQSAIGAINPHVLAQILANPAIASDPVVGALLAQQLNPLAQQQLPIRPLTGAQQHDPYQSAVSAVASPIPGQATDPVSALVQAQLISQIAANPLQQILSRAYAGAPGITGLGMSPITGQASSPAQTINPFGVCV